MDVGWREDECVSLDKCVSLQPTNGCAPLAAHQMSWQDNARAVGFADFSMKNDIWRRNFRLPLPPGLGVFLSLTAPNPVHVS